MSPVTVLDLFSGPGGFSQGFIQAGYTVAVGVDYDTHSMETYTHNHPESVGLCADLSEISSQEILDAGGLSAETVDVIIGGPPCQGFSIAGKRDTDDDRNELVLEFARHIETIQPTVFVMENVPGLLSMETPDGTAVIQQIQELFEEIGYQIDYTVLTASEYGVPQNRDRVFIIGAHEDETITFPNPTHGQQTGLQPHLTVDDAISDLPSLSAGETATTYTNPPQNAFQEQMRNHITDSGPLTNHDAVNHRDHIVERFQHIPQGGNMTDAPEEHQPAKAYSSRNRRLPAKKPSYTVTSHVLDELLHPWDDRAITVREAARLQSFPDNYTFIGPRNVFHGSDETSQYEQVGNAVPVALSQSLAKHIQNEYL